MAENDIKIKDLTEALQISNNAEFVYTQDNGGSNTTFKAKTTQLATKLNESVTYNNLQTTSKTIVGAINEVYGTWLTGTLTAGQTSITFTDNAITTDSIIQIFVDTSFSNVWWNSVTLSTGSLTISFPAQNSDMPVKVRLL